MRIFLGFLVAAVAIAAAVWLHSGYKARSYHGLIFTRSPYGGGGGSPYGRGGGSAYGVSSYSGTAHWKASWQDPVAILIAIAGVGAGVAIVRPRTRTAGER